MTLTDAQLTLTNGVVLGSRGLMSSYVVTIATGGLFRSEGKAEALNRLVHFSCVQEHANSDWTTNLPTFLRILDKDDPQPAIFCRFTEWASPGGIAEDLYVDLLSSSISTPLGFEHCQIGPGNIQAERCATAFTNCLFDRFQLVLEDASSGPYHYFYNNLFHGGVVELEANNDDRWFAYDNLFDQTTLVIQEEELVHGFNGYVTNFDRLTPHQGTDLILTNVPVYETGPLGTFYYPSDDDLLSTLLDRGSQDATNAGLYHFTTLTNGDRETNSTVDIGFHYVGVGQDSQPLDTDGEGLADYVEDSTGNGSIDAGETDPELADTDADGLSDLQETQLSNNVLVNDPAQDEGNEKNSQSETSLIAFGNRVIVAYVDTNRGRCGYGMTYYSCLESEPPPVIARDCSSTNPVEFIGWSLSRDGGCTFHDMDNLPLLQPGDRGNAGDPILGYDKTLGIIYLLGNPQRPSLYYPTNSAELYAPLWRSIDCGETFQAPVNIAPDFSPVGENDYLDKPSLVVDNFPGQGNGNLFAAIGWTADGANGFIICSASPQGTDWQVIYHQINGGGPVVAVTPAHELCLSWGETNALKFTKAASPWTNFPAPATVSLTNTNGARFHIFRSKFTDPDDYVIGSTDFSVLPNPSVTNHIYMVYGDYPTNGSAHPNIYFRQSTDGGINWEERIQVNSNANETDQWHPAFTVHPDGSKVFIAWYDRREDPTSNSLIRTYGVFASLPVTNGAAFANNFPISSVQFPPAFTGTNDFPGTYDPVYGPLVEKWDPRCCEVCGGTYRNFAGNDYDTAVSDSDYVYYSWSDNRLTCLCTNGVVRNQPDVRFVRVSWPP